MRPVTSWGRVRTAMEDVREPAFADAVAGLLDPDAPALAYGLGRSYGDLCLNDGGRLVATRRLDRLVAADWETGIRRAEAGISLDEILRLAVPRGWFCPSRRCPVPMPKPRATPITRAPRESPSWPPRP